MADAAGSTDVVGMCSEPLPPLTRGATAKGSNSNDGNVPIHVSYAAIQKRLLMSAEKTVAVSFRVSPRFKLLLEAAATREHRSQTNMLETLLFAYCVEEGLDIEPDQPSKKKAPGK